MAVGTRSREEARGMPSVSPDFEPKRFGSYVLLRRMGHGATASVYLASESTEAGRRPVVLKRLHEHLSEDPTARDVFLDEARLALSLHHPGIVEAHDHGIAEGRPFFTMAYVSSIDLETLFARLERETQRLPTPLVVRIGLDLLAALDYAHGRVDASGKPLGIVHRDISPENVLLTFSGHAMLLDFGIAKARTRQVRTSTGVVKGKFAYMAPEQAEADDVDARADLWSLGVLLWELFAGRRLFAASSQFAALTSSMLGVIPKLDATAGVPKALSDVIDRALQRERGQRYASAAAMAADLERALEVPAATPAELATFLRDRFPTEIARDAQLVAAPIPDVPAPTPVARTLPPPHPKRWTGLAIAASAVAVLGILAVALSPSDESPAPEEPRATAASVAAPPATTATAAPRATTATPAPPPAALPPAPIEPAIAAAPPSAPVSAPPAPRSGARPRSPGATASSGVAGARPTPTRETTATAPVAAATPTPAEAPSTGRLSLVTVPWSRVELDGRVVGNTPLVGIELPAGSHVLVLTNPEAGITMRYPVSIEPGRTTVRRIALGP